MSSDAELPLPPWAEDLRGRLLALEERVGKLETPAEDAPLPPSATVESSEPVRESEPAPESELKPETSSPDPTRRLMESIWPHFLLAEPFAPWKERIESALLQEPPSAAAAMLFASLHGYTACLLESDQKYLRDALREISRFLYAWIKEDGADERAAYQVALEWAGALNAECVGKGDIEVPEPGAPASNQWMTFPPRGGSSPDVATVRTWCVRDAQNRVIHRAEVFT